MDMLKNFTIYDRPDDYPDNVVVREWHIGAGEIHPASLYKCGSIDEARAYIQAISPDLVCLDRHPLDDPPIVETWL